VGDDGLALGPADVVRDDAGVLVRAPAQSDVGRRFPGGGFRLQPFPGTGIEKLGGDELLFADGISRSQPFVCMITAASVSVGFAITGCLVTRHALNGQAANLFWNQVTADLALAPAPGPRAEAASRIAEIFPWFVHNALIHYLSPRGLEQYSGGGWGTRDVAQGPVEMLLALGRPEPVRDILLRLFRQQNPDGDWPQWFMFFERERGIRPADSHGDIVFWPVLALAE
jgi:hypothetical protein